MRTRLLICLGVFAFITALSAQTPAPAYEAVLDSLLANYYPELPANDFLSISRQPDGYYVGIQGPGDVFSTRQYPFWLNGERQLRRLPFKRREAGQYFAHYGTENAGEYRARQFRRHLYFGFPGFTDKSIATLETKKQRSPDETRQLARAHAEHAMNLLNNQYGTSDPVQRFKLDEAHYEYLSAAQLEEYRYHQLKAIKYYGELPLNYQTPVGSASIKQGNEWINGYLTLLQYNSREVAETFVSQMPDTYDEHLKFCGRLLLESCPPNALLIVEGDNDTYPLLFLQLKEGLRTDILVVNRHLLNLPRYVQMLRKGKQIGGTLGLTTPQTTVRSWEGVSFMPGDRYELYTAPEVLEVLGDLPAYTQANVIPVLPFGGMQLSAKVDGPIFRPESRPLRLGNLVMMDLIATNFKAGRQVAVATTINQDYFAYANSWQQVGMVYNLGDEKPDYPIDLEGTSAWSALMFRRAPIDGYGRQSRFLLDRMETVIVDASQAIRRAGESEVPLTMINRYLSHLEYRSIFSRKRSIRLLREMAALGYDPVAITAYASLLRDVIEAERELADLSEDNAYLRALNYYISHGEFPLQDIY